MEIANNDNKNIAQKVMTGIRDNLLKPMASEIENKAEENIKQLHQALTEKLSEVENGLTQLNQKQDVLQDNVVDIKLLSKELSEKMTAMETEYNKLQQNQNVLLEELTKAISEVNW